MQVAINPNLYDSAQIYAKQRGLNLTAMIEEFLTRLIATKETAKEEETPDVVLSLLGSGAPVGKGDLNGREAYCQYVEEKYR